MSTLSTKTNQLSYEAFQNARDIMKKQSGTPLTISIPYMIVSPQVKEILDANGISTIQELAKAILGDPLESTSIDTVKEKDYNENDE